MKKCIYCKVVKPVSEFKELMIGRQSKGCNACALLHHNNYVKYIEKSLEYRDKNKEKTKIYNKNYHDIQKLTNINYLIEKKIHAYKQSDKLYKRPFTSENYINVNWVLDKLRECECRCCFCNVELELTNINGNLHSELLFSIDRLNNKVAHLKNGNCVISCLGCNMKRR